MELKERLTNEEISGKFSNQFNLVNYAISLATDMILSGREPRTTLHSENPAVQALEEIITGKDKFETLPKGRGRTEYHDMKDIKEVANEAAAADEKEAQK
jgi:DNA-directed RNA polymerase subunit omega